MEHLAAAPLRWEVDPAVTGHHKWGAVQGESIELDVGIVRISQGSEALVTDSPVCSSTSPWKVSFDARD